MRKFKFILTISSAFMLMAAYAQEPDKVLVKVQYSYIHINDTTKKNRPHIENMLLLAGKNASLYLSNDMIDQSINGEIRQQQIAKNGLTNQQTKSAGQISDAMQVSFTQYFFFNKERKFFTMEDMPVDKCLVEDNIDEIDWRIVKDTLSFLGIHCQKATARYKGRNWIAWFSTEFPFEAGPWKLHGLPGLIIAANDDKMEVQFKFNGIQNIKTGDLISDKANELPADMIKKITDRLAGFSYASGLVLDKIALPPPREARLGGYVNITQKDFDKLKAAYAKDYEGVRNAQVAARYTNMGMSPPAIRNVPHSEPAKSDINNPIELP